MNNFKRCLLSNFILTVILLIVGTLWDAFTHDKTIFTSDWFIWKTFGFIMCMVIFTILDYFNEKFSF